MSKREERGAPGTRESTGEYPRPLLSVLFIDPDTQSAQWLANAIRDRCAVAVVGSAREAMAAMSQRMPTLIVMELDLPDANGPQMLASLRNTPSTHNILLMIVTHRVAIRDKITAFQAGADDYLVKPVAAELFQTHVLLVSRFRQVIQR
ncbi:MAG: response regulator [Ktedonobacterales bacterium]|nr:response regulator [Ktedonobacterales bacterium]